MFKDQALSSYLKRVLKNSNLQDALALFDITKVFANSIIEEAKDIKRNNTASTDINSASDAILAVKHLEADDVFSSLDISESEKIVEEFFEFISPELANNYLNFRTFDAEHIKYVSKSDILEREKTKALEARKQYEAGEITKEHLELLEAYYHVESIEADFGANVDKNGVINICVQDTAEDMFRIVHEFTHKLFHENCRNLENMPQNHDFLVETASITMEMLLEDYLMNNDKLKDDAIKFKRKRLLDTKDGSYRFLFEMMLLDIVKSQGFINDDLLDLYIDLIDNEDIKQNFKNKKDTYINSIFEEKGLILASSNSYILGTIIGVYLKNIISLDHKNLDVLFSIGRGTYEEDIYEVLKRNGLDYFTRDIKMLYGLFQKAEFTSNPEKLNMLLDAFHKEMEEYKSRCQSSNKSLE